jgi:hypothetical protein
MENLFAKVTANESKNGSEKYRCIFVMNNHETLPLTDARLYLVSDSPYTTLRTQLASNGVENTVDCVDNASFPSKGAFFLEDEEILYTGKAGSRPTCSFTGCTRGSNSTTKVLHAVGKPIEDSQFRMAIEAPSAQPGYVQHIANEDTAPTSLSFTMPMDYDDGCQMGDLGPGEMCGIWLRRKVPKGSWAVALVNPQIAVEGTTDA